MGDVRYEFNPSDFNPDDLVDVEVEIKLRRNGEGIEHHIVEGWYAIGVVRNLAGDLLRTTNDMSELPQEELDSMMERLHEDMQGASTAYALLVIEQQRRNDANMRKDRLN
jgi:hypothetical protein